MIKDHYLLFGGTFDPIHHGHLIVARCVAEQLDVEKTILIPSANPPHKSNLELTDPQHRLAMTRLAVQGDSRFEVSDCELQRDAPSYTIDTVSHFRKTLGPSAHFYWLIGADTLKDLPQWYKIDQLIDLCTIVTAARCGFDSNQLDTLTGNIPEKKIARLKEYILQTPLIDIAATEIRTRLKKNHPAQYLLPKAVLDYIQTHNLYT